MAKKYTIAEQGRLDNIRTQRLESFMDIVYGSCPEKAIAIMNSFRAYNAAKTRADKYFRYGLKITL